MTTNEAKYREAEQQLWEYVGVTPTEQWLDLRRPATRVRVQVVGDGPPVVFVHGASNGGASWATLVNRLEGFRCILLDRPGCGLSPSRPSRFDDVSQLATFAEDLVVDVLDAMAIDTADVVATSFGGYIGLRTAAAHPDRVKHLVLFGWSVGAPIAKTPFPMRFANVPGMTRLTTSLPVNRRTVTAMLKQIGLRGAVASGRFSTEMVDWFVGLLRHTDTMRNELQAGPKLVTLVRGMNDTILIPPAVLQSIRVPTLFLWGTDDPMGGAATAHAFAGHVPNAQLDVMANAGHAPWIDDPDHASAAVTKFLAS
ncbi:MAG: alpha/beta hydrolase [Actinobacteria bacterium]|nr:alpha/beta hydrolase [Actinomycetota bacterium]